MNVDTIIPALTQSLFRKPQRGVIVKLGASAPRR